jgi:predicted RNA-binding protein associated with RNAse of E/G family
VHREGAAYAVWLFFDDGVFRYWYVNFEAPVVRHDGSFDTDDHGLDLIVHPDGRREWKDVDHLSELVRSGRMTGEQVVGVLHAAAEVTALLDADRRWWAPFDDWRP